MMEWAKKEIKRAVNLLLVTAVSAFALSGHAKQVDDELASDCEATPKVLSNTSLSGLADYWFGSPDFQFAILTATNARAGDPRFDFISNPNILAAGSNVCIPQIAEAERLKLRFDGYLEAVHDMALAEPSEVVNSLDAVPSSGAVTVVSWVRSDQAKGFGRPGSTYTSSGNIWVTLAPHVQEFCKDFVKNNSNNPDRLNLRLEQRLGLAPASSKTHFIELKINTPADGKSLFRPCGDSSVTTTSCALQAPTSCNINDKICHQKADFFYQQYYSSYGSARPVEFPWTSLGYTFDWAYKEAGLGGRFDFIQVGESEYVVPPNTEMEVVSTLTTAEYCGLK
ncbi:hypothetical protein NBRC116583_02700 [Arenicella sp. 4NH20-0111]|uniref:hypothetical protein n=1 Tax=Arenicella sp. 4NH20-0111 TaxID=3127648 RepID=UPI00310814A5